MNNFILVGAGGTGTHLLTPLVAYLRTTYPEGDWLLHIVDGDTVEPKNLERQLFNPSAITMNKATAAAAMMGDDGHIRAIPDYLSEENIPRILQENDTIFICVDNFTVRKRIEEHCLTLKNVAVINGGNEKYSGSIQLWVRADGANVTPLLSYMHPEVAVGMNDDRAEMTCAQAAALPGGAQTLIANAMTATWMLTALWRLHHMMHVISLKASPSDITWTELQFNFKDAWIEHTDHRLSKYWNKT